MNHVAQPSTSANEQTIGKRYLYFGVSVVVVILLGLVWARVVLPPFNSEHLGPDACHHVIIIYCQSVEDPKQREAILQFFHDYPQTAHWLTSHLMPLVDDDPYKAFRTAGMASLLLLLAMQYGLMRIMFSPTASVVAVMLWQLMIFQTKVANTNLLIAFFAQAMGTAFLWASIYFAAYAPLNGWRRWLMFTTYFGLALLSYLCHIAPGISILGGLGTWCLLHWLRSRTLANLLAVAAVGVLGLGVIFGTGQLKHMSEARVQDGMVSLRNTALLWTWIPTLLIASIWYGRRWWQKGERTTWENVWELMLCLIAVTGLLQLYCVYEWQQGKAASYTLKKFFYVLFPATVFIWVMVIARILEQWSFPSWNTSRAKKLQPILWLSIATIAAFYNHQFFVKNELLTPPVGAERHPVLVAKKLKQQYLDSELNRAKLRRHDLLYYDPALPQSNLFINTVGLQRTFKDAATMRAILKDWKPGEPIPAELNQQVPYQRLMLPEE